MNDKILTWEEAVLWLRSRPDQTELVRACYYDDPLIDAADRFYQSSEWKEIQNRLERKTGKILDLGAGRGISSYAFARDEWEVVAVEPDPSRIVGVGAIKDLASDSHLPISVIQSFAESLPFRNNSFDVVYGRQILHHAQNLSIMCSEVSRVLKPDGIFMATREHVISKKEDLDIFLAQHPLQKLYGGENAYLLNQYLDALTDSDIEITDVLNPCASNINLFPESLDTIKKQMAKKIFFPLPSIIPTSMIKLLGLFDKSPGRLYSFIGRKKNER
jgi:ubiquinone/menaquinone biosynthesis C-methylase UbiE